METNDQEQATYDVHAVEQKWRQVWDGLDAFRAGSAAPNGSREALRADDVPLPQRRPAHGPRRGDGAARRDRALLVAARPRRPEPHGLGLLRPARGERRDQERRAPGDLHLRQHRQAVRVVPQLRDQLRLVAPVQHQRPGVLPLDPVAVPEVPRARAGLPQEQPGQLVPQRPDRAGQRAGRRRPLRALRRRGDQARADPVVLQDHRLRAAAAGRHGAAGGHLAGAGPDRAEELDRPVRGRPRRVRRRRAHDRRIAAGVHDAAGHAVRHDVHGGRRRRAAGRSELCAPEQQQALEDYLVEVRMASEIERLATDRPKTGVDLGVTATNPVNGAAGPGVGLRLRAGRLRHRRDHGGARRGPARLGLRRRSSGMPIIRTIQPPEDWEGEAFTGRGAAINSANDEVSLDGLEVAEAKSRIIAWLESKGAGQGHRQLPAARLAAEPAALLGLPDPDRALREGRRGAGALRPAAGACCPTCGART